MNMHLTISKKLAAMTVCLASLAALESALAIRNALPMVEAARAIDSAEVPALAANNRLAANLLRFHADGMKYLLAADASDMRAAEEAMRQERAALESAKRKLGGLPLPKAVHAELDQLAPKLGTYFELVDQMVELSRALKKDEAQQVYRGSLETQYGAVRVALNRLDEVIEAAAGKASSSSVGTAEAGIREALLCGLLALAVGVVLSWFTIRSINSALRHRITELIRCAEEFFHGVSQSSAASQMLAHGASEQAASLEETSAASEQIGSMARKNRDSLQCAAELAAAATANCDSANQLLEEMIAAMNHIGESSTNISKIIKAIDEIAFQTNILALNAAVEAARAGEAGAGFAVVADEVRNLAQRCAQAAQDTSVLIQELITRSDGGKQRVGHVAKAIREITSESAQIQKLTSEISLGSDEQTRGIEQIGKSLLQIENVTQANAASAEQSAATASELKAQTESLRRIADSLRLLVQSDVIAGGSPAAGALSPASLSAATPPDVIPGIADENTRQEMPKAAPRQTTPKAEGTVTLAPASLPTRSPLRSHDHASAGKPISQEEAEQLLPMEGDFREF